MEKASKTIYRYDARGTGFKKAALFLLALSVLLAAFGFYWLISWI
tara:strand:- start:152 stop:286 length:135 start_codon:yes stop_codon:yes gene_type:complete